MVHSFSPYEKIWYHIADFDESVWTVIVSPHDTIWQSDVWQKVVRWKIIFHEKDFMAGMGIVLLDSSLQVELL